MIFPLLWLVGDFSSKLEAIGNKKRGVFEEKEGFKKFFFGSFF